MKLTTKEVIKKIVLYALFGMCAGMILAITAKFEYGTPLWKLLYIVPPLIGLCVIGEYGGIFNEIEEGEGDE